MIGRNTSFLNGSTKPLEIDTTISILTDTTISVSKPMKHRENFDERKKDKILLCL
jgi:hypothetical protein